MKKLIQALNNIEDNFTFYEESSRNLAIYYAALELRRGNMKKALWTLQVDVLEANGYGKLDEKEARH